MGKCVVCGEPMVGGYSVFGKPMCKDHYLAHVEQFTWHKWDKIWAEYSHNPKKMVIVSDGKKCAACGMTINGRCWELSNDEAIHITKADCEIEVIRGTQP